MALIMEFATTTRPWSIQQNFEKSNCFPVVKVIFHLKYVQEIGDLTLIVVSKR